MKLLAIGDIHGRTNWVNIVAKHNVDKVVFLGDYFDAKEDITSEYQQLNFEDIVAYKRRNRDKVVLLMGNHDYHYLKGVEERYSGFQRWQYGEIQALLHSALDEDLLQLCFLEGNVLFSHAGVTKTWLDTTGYSCDVAIDRYINSLFRRQPSLFGIINTNSVTSDEEFRQSPIWVRPRGLLPDMIDSYVQVVGHTPQSRLNILPQKLAFIDTLGTSGEYLYLENGQMRTF